MARCEGVSQRPAEILKPVRRYPANVNGKMRSHYISGYATCPSCNRVVTTRPDKNNETILCYHSPVRRKSDEHRERYARRYFQISALPYPVSTFAGTITQTVNANPDHFANYNIEATPSRVIYQNRDNIAFSVELESNTTNAAGQWVFNINGYPTVAPTSRITIVTNNFTWDRWNNQYNFALTSQIRNTQIWGNWQTVPLRGYTQADVQRETRRRGLTYARPVETPEERQARQQAEALALFQRVEAERLASQSAAERALGTLLGLLTEEQREEYAKFNYFHVVGSKGRLYRIHKGSSGNIRRVVSREDTGRGEAAFCVHSIARVDHSMEELGLTPGYLPHEDHMIQQMLHLMIDEDEILAKANIHWGTREPTDAELERFFAAEEANQRERERNAVGV